MEILTTIQDIREKVSWIKGQGKSIGFVPTMGYLHEGHLTLVKEAKKECDFVILSIFVNPLQFGIGEDFEEYPRDLSRDTELAKGVGVDLIFAPSVKEMYPKGFQSYVDVKKVTEGLCGASRPGHFIGVTTVVNKLLNLTQADKAYFGQKDAQQVAVISTMVRDLNMNVEIIAVPIVREGDGLALSSRNVYLSPTERRAALVLNRSLQRASDAVSGGQREGKQIIEIVNKLIQEEPLAVIDYIELVSYPSLEPLDLIEGQVLLALAVRFGKTRLIDNIIMEVR